MNSTHHHTHNNETTNKHHEHSDEMSDKEVIALLSYMIDHNKHHEEELRDLACNMSENASALIHEAQKHYSSGTDLLVKALSTLQD